MTTPNERPLDGILIVNKPKDWTSHDVCAFIRKRFKIKKVGHGGTLDPLATGVLVILLGKATKESAQITSSDKSYEGVMELGIATDTHDVTGQVTREAPWEGITLEMIREKVRAFTGSLTQVPPMVSALKHKGVRLYKLARQGREVPREGRSITVYSFDILGKDGRFVTFFMRVSKGTYVRTLIHDLGTALGCHAALRELKRLHNGNFSIDQSVTVDELRNLDRDQLRTKILPLPTRTLSHAYFD